ncbi:centrosomal protein of 83 kDa-like [Oppia nitens]|uniref:centrosomal protein of 83 kDa-like n=1 Tax=Oppia nitens TaxID=1686743 RepID=UPI0023DAECEB|nr:centrosomal protein of 83 kDa-like [Oppia nitens]
MMDQTVGSNPVLSTGSSRAAVVVTNREQELQKLLAEERLRSEQRKNNYSTLREEHLKLQKDFVTLQADMRQVLAETKQIKDKKDDEVDQMIKVCEERDKMIETLKSELKELDPQVIKHQFEDELKEPLNKLHKSYETVIRDKERLGYELKIAKQKIEFLEKENLETIERLKLSFESEINLIKKEKEEMRNKLLEVNQLPDVMRFTDLNHENQRLSAKVKSYQTTLEDAEQQYKRIETKVESLVTEHENSEKSFGRQISELNSQLKSLSDNNLKLQQTISNNEREKENLLAEIDRLRLETNRLNKMLDEKDKDFTTEKDRIKNFYLLSIKEVEDQKDIVVNQLKKLKADFETKDESMKRLDLETKDKERDFELKMTEIRQQEFDRRCAIEQEKNSMHSKIKDLKEEKTKLKEEIQQMKRQIENMSELRLSVERESMMLRAKIESHQLNIEELDKLRRQHIQLHDNLNKQKSENTEYSALNKDLIRQRDQYKSDYQRIKDILDEERKHLEEFKILSDKNVVKLKNCIEEERYDFKDKLLGLERDVIKIKKERDELRTKYSKYLTIAEKLQSKLLETKEKEKQKTLESSHRKSSHGMAGVVSADAHNQLKKELKLLKKKQNEIAFQLSNCSFDSPHCRDRDVKDTQTND